MKRRMAVIRIKLAVRLLIFLASIFETQSWSANANIAASKMAVAKGQNIKLKATKTLVRITYRKIS
jgi:hypothetical protein